MSKEYLNSPKIYTHLGNGHYIGSVVVVVAGSIDEAKSIIKNYLVENGLPNEELNVKEWEFKECSVIYATNGDY